jgi:hypothetical protein
MSEQETRTIVGKINEAVEKIRARMNYNTIIFIVILSVSCATAWVTWRHDKSLDRLTVLASDNYRKILETRAQQDAQDQITVHYIQDTITAINKLQRDNPSVKVPKAPEIRLPNVPPPTSRELERPQPVATPSPTPQPAASHSLKKKARRTLSRPQPSATPWWHFWKQTR